jgi:hypothetical protein
MTEQPRISHSNRLPVRMNLLTDTYVGYERSLRWKVIAPDRVHMLTASPHLDTSTAAVDRRMPLIE